MIVQNIDISAALKKKSLRESCLGSIQIKMPRFAQSHRAGGFVRFVNRYLYPLGIGAALNRYDSSITFYASRKDKHLYRAFDVNALFCNFGSGAFQHPRWKNYDYPGVSKYYKSIQGIPEKDFFPIDLCVDNLVLPFENNSVSLIYCAHTLEHLQEDKALRFLSECARILKPSGVMRIAVPNTESDFNFSKILDGQKNISEDDKLTAMRMAATHLLTHTETLPDLVLMEDMRAADFSTTAFLNIVTQQRSISNRFDGSRPEVHICHWSHTKLAALSAQLGFHCYLPLYRSYTSQAPFCNIEVFDTTEPHLSLYGELVGVHS